MGVDALRREEWYSGAGSTSTLRQAERGEHPLRRLSDPVLKNGGTIDGAAELLCRQGSKRVVEKPGNSDLCLPDKCGYENLMCFVQFRTIGKLPYHRIVKEQASVTERRVALPPCGSFRCIRCTYRPSRRSLFALGATPPPSSSRQHPSLKIVRRFGSCNAQNATPTNSISLLTANITVGEACCLARQIILA